MTIELLEPRVCSLEDVLSKRAFKCKREAVSEDENQGDTPTWLRYIEDSVDPEILQSMELPQTLPDPAEELEARIEKEKLEEGKQQKVQEILATASQILTDKQLRAFYLYYVLGLPQVKVAEVCAITQPGVAILLRLALDKLRTKFGTQEQFKQDERKE
jgi:DNA-directed RNA polymerase specialized sigma24 family protein